MRRIGVAAAAVALLAGYVGLGRLTPAFDDELYYWCWSQQLQPSYFDHPPLTAVLIRASTEAFGHSLTAVRLPAAASAVAVLGVLAAVTRPVRFLGLAAVTPAFVFAGVIVTPDTPLMLFWAGYLGWLTRVHGRLTPADGSPPRPVPAGLWVVGGLLLGGGGLGKYTMVLAVPSGLLTFVLAGRVPLCRWLPGYLAHGAVAGLMVTPVLAFNLRHDFAPLRFQWAHAMGDRAGGFDTLSAFAGTQMVLVGSLPLALLPWAVWHARRLAADPRLRVAGCLYAVPLAFFLWKAAGGPLEANWALASYVGFWPVAAHWAGEWATTPARRLLAAATFALPAGCTAVALAHLADPLPPIPPAADRVTRQAVRVAIAARAAEAVRATGDPSPVYAASYQWTAMLRYFGADARQLAGATRPSHFTLDRADALTDVDRAFVFNEGPLPAHMCRGFAFPHMLANFPVVVRGETVGYVQLYRYTRPAGVAGRRPDPRRDAR